MSFVPPRLAGRALSPATLTRRGQIQAMRLGIPGSIPTVVPTQLSDSAENRLEETARAAPWMPGGTTPATVHMLQHLPHA